jgi:hypothetical protein
MTQEGYAELLKLLWPESEDRFLWGVLDAARDREIYFYLLNSYLDYSCLYAGELAPEVESNAPHLVKLEQGDRGSKDLVRKAWGNSWAIFAEYRGHVSDLRRHFRRLLVAKDHMGRKLLFRYYDPRVFRAYLPTCNAEELGTVFGPAHAFWVESPDTGEALRFRVRSGELITERFPLP